MAAFSLWQALNQRRAYDNSDLSDADRRHATGQGIGQSLVDWWDRAAADATGPGSNGGNSNPYIDHLADQPPPPGTPTRPLQRLPYYPTGQMTAGSLPLAAGNLAPDLSEPRSEGEGPVGPNRNPNVHPAFFPLLYPLAAAAWEASPWLIPLIIGAEYTRRQLSARPATTSPPPNAPVPQGPNGATPTVGPYPPQPLDAGPSSRSRTDPQSDPTNHSTAVADETMQAGSATPTSAQIIAALYGSKSAAANLFAPGGPWSIPDESYELGASYDPMAGNDSVSMTRRSSDRFHDKVVDQQLEALQRAGCRVVPELRFRGLDRPSIGAWPDLTFQCAPRRVHSLEAKTGLSPTYNRRQAWVFPQMMIGQATSPDPRITTFGLQPDTQLPPIGVTQLWAKRPGDPYLVNELKPEYFAQ